VPATVVYHRGLAVETYFAAFQVVVCTVTVQVGLQHRLGMHLRRPSFLLHLLWHKHGRNNRTDNFDIVVEEEIQSETVLTPELPNFFFLLVNMITFLADVFAL
jgi:hypothetical protein